MNSDFIPQISDEAIARAALRTRKLLGHAETHRLPMVELLELEIPKLIPGCEIHIDPTEQMGDVEAYVANVPPRIVLSESTYEKVWADNDRIRFTLAHEFGHLFFHLGYLDADNGRAERSSSYKLSFLPKSERQANRFAVTSFSLSGLHVSFQTQKNLRQPAASASPRHSAGLRSYSFGRPRVR